MPTRAEYAAVQTSFQALLEEVRVRTEQVRRLGLTATVTRAAADIEAHRAAQRVLREMTQDAIQLRDARDRVWRQLKGQS